MTVVSQVAHLVMKMQQDVADLVNKGDETLEQLFPPEGRAPEMGDVRRGRRRRPVDDPDDAAAPRNGERLTEGRFALYSTGEPETPCAEPEGGRAADRRARRRRGAGLRVVDAGSAAGPAAALRVADLEALLAYEGATKARAPFQTLLANRITRATAK